MRNRYKWKEHIDHKWIDEKIGGHGGGYGFDTVDGIVTIDFICGKNHIQLFWYNIILFVKYLIRKANKLLNKN